MVTHTCPHNQPANLLNNHLIYHAHLDSTHLDSSLSNCEQFFENFISLFVQLLHFALDNFNFAFDCTHTIFASFLINFTLFQTIVAPANSKLFYYKMKNGGKLSLVCAWELSALIEVSKFLKYSLSLHQLCFPHFHTHSHPGLSFNLCTYTTYILLPYIWFSFWFGFSFTYSILICISTAAPSQLKTQNIPKKMLA